MTISPHIAHRASSSGFQYHCVRNINTILSIHIYVHRCGNLLRASGAWRSWKIVINLYTKIWPLSYIACRKNHLDDPNDRYRLNYLGEFGVEKGFLTVASFDKYDAVDDGLAGGFGDRWRLHLGRLRQHLLVGRWGVAARGEDNGDGRRAGRSRDMEIKNDRFYDGPRWNTVNFNHQLTSSLFIEANWVESRRLTVVGGYGWLSALLR